MRSEEKAFLSTLSQILWQGSEQSKSVVSTTLSAVSGLAFLNEEEAFERAAAALFERAPRGGVEGGGPWLGFHALDSLGTTEKFLLLVLHRGQWSYFRIARVLKKTVDQVQYLAWRARIQFFEKLTFEKKQKVVFPYAPLEREKKSCPEYISESPWTQRFLDDSWTHAQDRVQIQNHLFSCLSCQKALNRYRDFYFLIDSEIKTFFQQADELVHSSNQKNWQFDSISSKVQTENQKVKILGGLFFFFLLAQWVYFLFLKKSG